MPKPLTISEKALRRHVRTVESVIRSIVKGHVGLEIQGWDVGSLVSAILIGQDCERVSRVRGPDTFVAPLRELGRDLWAWLGLREEWSRSISGNSRQFEFRSIGLTVHFGFKNEGTKPQMFRAEWSGWSKWHGTNYTFQGGNVGHPHWQYDALDSVSTAIEKSGVIGEFERLQEDDATVEIREFNEGVVSRVNIEEEVRSRKLSRFHFPSAAAWWMQSPHNLHTHAPQSENEIESWASETLTYTVRELARV